MSHLPASDFPRMEPLGTRRRAPKDPGVLPLAMHDIFQA